jgi:muramidase (phage lysozyme)
MAQSFSKKNLSDFFNVILKGESKTYNDHNWYARNGLNGYIEGRNINKYPLLTKNLSAISLGQLKQYQARGRDNNGQLWATGRYQIIPDTLKGLQANLSLPDSTKYDKETQDKMGLQLLLNRSGIKNYITQVVDDNKVNLERASLDVAKIWSSVGVPYAMKGNKQQISKNQSYYSGGGDKASETTESVQIALKKLRDGYKSVASDDNGSNNDNKGLKIVFVSVLSLALVGLGIYAYFNLIKVK